MSEPIDLVDFLLARLAEQEAWIRGDGRYLDECQECAFGQQPQSPYSIARVLAECEANRRIVELHAPDLRRCLECGGTDYPVEWPCPTLRLLALPYADHPDYREEWRP